MLKEAVSKEKGSPTPNRDKIGKLKRDDLRKIAEVKMRDMNARNVEAAMNTIAGTARSMGIDVV